MVVIDGKVLSQVQADARVAALKVSESSPHPMQEVKVWICMWCKPNECLRGVTLHVDGGTEKGSMPAFISYPVHISGTGVGTGVMSASALKAEASDGSACSDVVVGPRDVRIIRSGFIAYTDAHMFHSLRPRFLVEIALGERQCCGQFLLQLHWQPDRGVRRPELPDIQVPKHRRCLEFIA
jgi:hypothetical protein